MRKISTSLVLLSLLLACFISLGTADWRQQQEQRQQGNDNPYVFDERHFNTERQSELGRVRITPKFTDRSPLLRGIENYRVAIFEAEPQTFILPSHYDADAVFFVANGRATLTFAKQDGTESFSIKEGDVVRVRAGSSGYVVNQDNNQRLVLVKLLIPVNTPGETQRFAAGGEITGSFLSVFSNEILQAALNTRSERIQRLFGQQKQGWIVKASEQQIRALSHDEKGGIWPFQRGESSRNTYNLYEERPRHSNQYGQHYEVDENQFKQLREHNLRISLANITRGAMTDIYYNSKATKIFVVLDGFGDSQMACPHLSQQQGGQQGSQGQQQQRPGQHGSQDWPGSRQGQQGGQQGKQGSQEWQPGQQGGQQGQQGSQEWQPGQQGGQQRQQGGQEWQPGQQGGQQGQQGSQEWHPGQQQGQQGSQQGGRPGRQGRQEQGGQQGSQGQQQSGPRYQRLTAVLKPGTVVVVPAGHPFVAVASNNQNLQLLAFEINGHGNEVFTLAGRGNIISQLEREAKALSFGVPAELVDEVFGGQNEQIFLQGPRQQGQRRAYA